METIIEHESANIRMIEMMSTMSFNEVATLLLALSFCILMALILVSALLDD